MPRWLDWFKLQRKPSKPVCQQFQIGEIHIESGSLLLSDPAEPGGATKVDGVPPGSYPVQAVTILYPGGFSHVVKIGIRFRPGTEESRRKVGHVGGESGMIVAGDAAVIKNHWQEVGPGRIGISSGASSLEVTRLIEKRFGVNLEPRSICSRKSVQPISEELEGEITAYLETFPEYARFSFLHFMIHTDNSYDRAAESLRDRAWSEVELDPDSEATVIAMRTGHGDGDWFDLYGIFQGETLLGIESEFMSPEVDDALKDAPRFCY